MDLQEKTRAEIESGRGRRPCRPSLTTGDAPDKGTQRRAPGPGIPVGLLSGPSPGAAPPGPGPAGKAGQRRTGCFLALPPLPSRAKTHRQKGPVRGARTEHSRVRAGAARRARGGLQGWAAATRSPAAGRAALRPQAPLRRRPAAWALLSPSPQPFPPDRPEAASEPRTPGTLHLPSCAF